MGLVVMWLHMLAEDLDELSSIDEGDTLHDYISSRDNIWTLLKDWEAREMFLKIDVAVES